MTKKVSLAVAPMTEAWQLATDRIETAQRQQKTQHIKTGERVTHREELAVHYTELTLVSSENALSHT